MRNELRKSTIAGSWYPADPRVLGAELDSHLAGVPPRELGGRLVGLVSPHAGLRYSGPVAAHAYALVRGRAGLSVVLVGPSHRAAFDGAAVFPRGGFETPLGIAPVDGDLADRLLSAPAVVALPAVHADEHSLEMQLPFLQHLVPGLRIVPVLMGDQSREATEAVAQALARALAGSAALLVASSDLSHYHPAPVASALDARVADDVACFDAERLMTRLESSRVALDERRARVPGHAHACGGGPIVAVMRAARALGADRSTVLRYADSGDVPGGDKSRVVGYLAAAFTAPA